MSLLIKVQRFIAPQNVESKELKRIVGGVQEYINLKIIYEKIRKISYESN